LVNSAVISLRIFALFFSGFCAAFASCAQAGDPLPPGEFERFSKGQTLYFEWNGEAYGAEQFFENRRSIWQFTDGTCDYGQWFVRNGAICFSYDRDPAPVCWSFEKEGSRFVARLRDTELPLDLEMAKRDQKPLDCPAPDLGV
jgi:hypothetical protein